ncbi:MAG TPA: hypothetical protein VN456_00300 [Desulfosporosinus sp.]|nr:hypothetical protein [Desulfosporosinus sp.]
MKRDKALDWGREEALKRFSLIPCSGQLVQAGLVANNSEYFSAKQTEALQYNQRWLISPFCYEIRYAFF